MNKIRAVMVGSAVLIFVLAIIISLKTTDYSEKIINEFYFESTLENQDIKLVPWLDETDGKYYLFLPS